MKPILFNTDMVCAILENRKTVTRRVVKPQERILEDAVFGYTAFTPKGCISVRGWLTAENGERRFGENFLKIPYRIPDNGRAAKSTRIIYYSTFDKSWSCDGMIVTHWMLLPLPPEEVNEDVSV